ncbi:Glycogen synthase [Serratia ficaria]|uniref:glycosyltransferase family 4 protein n=1 Tax=Serratia ficaria TaxID=61651 RepID=UPI0021826D5F|nr:glycosyltransferase family 1 protein [Serratia ficaria]CAI2415505.1 Glycogen synthase [Serratia ficaria]
MKVIFGTDPIKYPLTGIGRYAYELASCLKESSDISELLFLQGRNLSRQIPIAKESSSSVQGLRRWAQKNRLASELYRVATPWLKTYALKKHPDAIYHSPNFYLPPNVDRCLATFHDLSVFTWPQCHPAERVRFMQKELLLTIKRADILITDSEFTRHELAEYFNLPLSKVYAAQLASSGNFYPRVVEDITPVLAPLGLRVGQYCLFTGSIEPRKNIETLLDAYERLPSALRLAVPLVISGFKGWSSGSLHQRFERAENAGWLRYLGYTKSVELPYLFAGARSFLFPSLYEGFGLPVLEAMASGVPVVCSNSASLPEVVGDCALMCAAKDVETLTELIKKSIEDEIWREEARIKGLDRAKHFSWQRCAQETIHAYQQV